MELFLIYLIFVLFCGIIISYYSSNVGIIAFSLGFILICGGPLYIIITLLDGRNVRHEIFFSSIAVTLVTIFLPYHLAISYPTVNRWNIVTIAGILTFDLSWAMLTASYMWAVSDLIARFCPSCPVVDIFYGYEPEAPLSHCVVWDSAIDTTRCLYPTVILPIVLISISLAILSMILTYWYTEELSTEEVATFLAKEIQQNENDPI